MKGSKISIFALCLIAVCFAGVAFIKPKQAVIAKPPMAEKGFAVAELFTSEGCSSCPAADAVVAKIEKENAGKPVYILAYHVDYWNRLGWKDVFSNADYSRRQNMYANRFKLSSVYTPQLIVNGSTEFVGSQEGKLRSVIKSSLQKAQAGQLTLNNLTVDGKRATLNYSVSELPTSADLLIALIQKNASTIVKSGENGGHTLSHVQIVNRIQSSRLSKKTGELGIALPNNFEPKSFEIIAFVQTSNNGEIAAAARLPFAIYATASK